MEKKRYSTLQLFRIAACFGVFCVHFGQRVDLTGLLRSVTDFGRFGVQMFFIISGLLAAKGLEGKKNIWTYYKKRMITILPLYYFVIAWFFVSENILERFWTHIPEDSLGLGWFRYLFLLNGFIPDDGYFWNNIGITWTIPIFAFFYLIAPWVMKGIRSYKSGGIALIAVGFITYAANKFYPCSIFENLYFFFMGILVYFFWRDDLLRPGAFFFLVMSIGEMILNRSGYPAIFASMICLAIEKEFKLPEKVQRVVDVLDSHTYTFYLLHGIVFCSLLDRLREDRFNTPRILIVIIAITGSVLGTVIIHRFFEKPVQELLREKLISK